MSFKVAIPQDITEAGLHFFRERGYEIGMEVEIRAMMRCVH
jgi:hypothetical protein